MEQAKNLKISLPRRKKNRKTLTKENKISIRKRYLGGEKIKDIAQAEDIAISTIYRVIDSQKEKKNKRSTSEVLLRDGFDVDEFTKKIMLDVYD
jgi:transposase-like protein